LPAAAAAAAAAQGTADSAVSSCATLDLHRFDWSWIPQDPLNPTADAPVATGGDVRVDPAHTSTVVIALDDTIQEGRPGSRLVLVPTTATRLTISGILRAASAPVGATTVQLQWYRRRVDMEGGGTGWAAWTAAPGVALDPIAIPAGSALEQAWSGTYTLAALGLVAGAAYQVAITRADGGAALAGDAYLSHVYGTWGV
jgi:hypothetical protein